MPAKFCAKPTKKEAFRSQRDEIEEPVAGHEEHGHPPFGRGCPPSPLLT